MDFKTIKGKNYKEVLQFLQNKLENYDDKEGIERLLTFQKNFRQYSFQNTVLIYFQRPKATMVAGLKTWNKLGRRVKKGETGIRIFAPRYKVVEVQLKVENENDEEDEGKVTLEKVKKLFGFIVVSVFDISQTIGKDVLGPSLYTPYSSHEELFQRILSVCPVPVFVGRTEDINQEIKGFYAPASGRIKLSENLKGDNRLTTLIHELAHYYSHNTIEHKYNDVPEEKRRAIHEIVAEGASFVFFKQYDVDVRPSYQYLYSWTRCGKENILEYGELIRQTANKLIGLAETSNADITTKIAV